MSAVLDPLAGDVVPDQIVDPLAGDVVPDLDALTRPSVQNQSGLLNAALAGLQNSGDGLLIRGFLASVQGRPLSEALPTRELAPDATVTEQLVSATAGLVADTPLIIYGAMGGAAAGTAVAGPGGGTLVGGAAGGFGLPLGTREYLMQAYSTDGIRSFGDFWKAIKAMAYGTTEGAALGVATTVPGVKIAQVTTGVVKATLVPLSELASLTTTAAALQGRLPTRDEFTVNAVLITGFKAAPRVSVKMQEIYAKTGIEPARVVADIARDPSIKVDILDPAREGVPRAYEAKAAAENAKAAVPDPMSPADRALAMKFVENPFAELGQGPGQKTQPTDVNYNFTNSSAEVAGAQARLSDLYQTRIQAERRDVRSWEQGRKEATEVLAETLGVSVGKLPVETGINPRKLEATLRAKNQLVEGAAADAVSKAKRLSPYLDKATPEQIADVLISADRAAMYHAEFLGLRADVARAQNSLKDLKRSNMAAGDLIALIEAKGGRTNARGLIEALANADNPAAALRVARAGNRSGLAKALNYWKASILSGLGTFESNVLGGMTAIMSVPERVGMVASGRAFEATNKILAKLQGKEYVPETRASIHEAASLLVGVRTGALEGLKLAGAVAQSAAKERIALVAREARRLAKIQAGKEGLPLNSRDYKARVAEIVASPDPARTAQLTEYAETVRLQSEKVEREPPAPPGTAGYVIETPFRVFLQAPDAMFRTMIESSEAAALATRDALALGHTVGSPGFKVVVNDIILNPTAKRTAEIQAQGDYGTYTQKLGTYGRALQQLTHGSVWGFILPFIQGPINLTKFSAGYIPGVNLISTKAREDLAAGGVRRDRIVARMVIGTAISQTVMAGVEGDTVSGGWFHLTQEERNAKIAAKELPYAFKINGTWYEYKRLQPMAMAIGASADYAEITNHAGKKDLAMLGAIVAATGNATISQNYLQGLSNAVNAISDPARYGDRWLDQYAASTVPSFIGQTAAAMDPQSREINSIFDAVQARIPIWREELLPVRNAMTGQPNTPKKLFPMGPIRVSEESTDKVLTEAARLGVSVPSAPRSVQVGKGKIGKVTIEDENRNEYVRVVGEFSYQILSQIVGSPTWDSLPEPVQRNIYKGVLSSARAQGTLVALPPEVRVAESMRIAQEIAAEYVK